MKCHVSRQPSGRDLEKIFRHGVENDRVGKGVRPFFSWKVLAFDVAICFQTPVNRRPWNDDVLVINGSRQERLADEVWPGEEGRFYWGRSALDAGKRAMSLVADLSTPARIGLWVQVLKGLVEGISASELGLYFEFALLKSFVSRPGLDRVSEFGHYDRYATWLSGLCALYGVRFRLLQHGALATQEIPNRLRCDEVVCFNEQERAIFENRIVANPDCLYSYRRPAGIEFSMLGDSPRPVVAIASQGTLTETSKALLSKVDSKIHEATIVFYLHHEDTAFGSIPPSRGGNRILVEERARYSDIDVLITFFSSIVYDYLYCKDFQGRIVCMRIKGIEMAFYANPRVEIARGEEDLDVFLSKLIEPARGGGGRERPDRTGIFRTR